MIPVRRGAGAPGARRAAALLAALCVAAALRVGHAQAAPPRRAAGGGRRLLARVHRIPYGAYDRESMTGAAKGQRAGGEPDAVPGLASPDAPVLGPRTASMEDLVLPLGYPLESYPVETPDGFVLRLYRIPRGKANATGAGPRPVVLLHHGVTLASNSFVVLDPASSMGFYLADAGFDVWMVNTRGNTYSRGHRRYRNTDQAYWANSMDELALLDLPAQIDFALKASGQQKLSIVGHSQGCTLPLMLLAAKPEYNAKVALLMMLGPVVNARLMQAPFLGAQARTGSAKALLKASGSGAFIPNVLAGELFSGCRVPATTPFCFDLVNFMFYGPSTAVSPDDYMKVGATWPASVATRNLEHWSQLYDAGNGLRMYDFGSECSLAAGGGPQPYQESCNDARYGRPDPPPYDLKRVTAPAAVYESKADLMSTPKDNAQLRKDWGARLVHHVKYTDTAHMDFVWAREPIMRADITRTLWSHAR